MSWNSDDLFSKARLYIDRAYRSIDEPSSFALWIILALELLARSAISNVHPILLANPNQVKNLYYAIGREELCDYPKSVPAKTIYERCETLFDDFTPLEKKYCNALRELRNTEIHSGESVLELIPIPNWQLRYYRVCQIFLNTLDLELEDFFPLDHMDSIVEILNTDEQDERTKVVTLLAQAKRAAGTTELDIERYRESLNNLWPIDIDRIVGRYDADCPVCNSSGEIGIKRISMSEIKLVDDIPLRTVTYIPIDFLCRSCNLWLDSYSRLVMAGLGDPIVTDIEIDLTELFMWYMEPDYGNE